MKEKELAYSCIIQAYKSIQQGNKLHCLTLNSLEPSFPQYRPVSDLTDILDGDVRRSKTFLTPSLLPASGEDSRGGMVSFLCVERKEQGKVTFFCL